MAEHRLQRECLAVTPLTQSTIECMYEDVRYLSELRAQTWVTSLCRSHERLRAELAGAEIVIEHWKARWRELEAKVKQQQQEIMDLRTELNRERSV